MDTRFFFTILKLVMALVFILLLAYFSIRFGLARLYAPGGRTSYIRVIDQLCLAPRTFLILIQVGEEYYLLTSFNGQINAIKKLAGKPAAIEEAGTGGRENLLEEKYFGTTPFLTRFFAKLNYFSAKGKR